MNYSLSMGGDGCVVSIECIIVQNINAQVAHGAHHRYLYISVTDYGMYVYLTIRLRGRLGT